MGEANTPAMDDGDVRIYQGDALDTLRQLPDESVHCIVTSPPLELFWGLRDYGTGTWEGGDPDCDHGVQRWEGEKQTQGAQSGHASAADRLTRDACGKCGARRVDHQIGLEKTPDEWCANLVAVFRECRRVLRSDGVCWIEVGDTYHGGGYSNHAINGPEYQEAVGDKRRSRQQDLKNANPDIKPKDLVGAPWMLAFALRADGWYLRSDTIWARPNPMPESVTDRPTKAHSYVFLLTKSARYFYDADAIRQPHVDDWHGRASTWRDGRNVGQTNGHHNPTGDAVPFSNPPNPAGANARSVWQIATEPTPFAHFATMPQALAERCIKAGTSEHGCCSECGAPWSRVVEATGATNDRERKDVGDFFPNKGGNASGIRSLSGATYQRQRQATEAWKPTCDHDAPVVPCAVLDPFMGSGTTAVVARRLGRHSVGVELNAEYIAISARRLQQLSLFGGGE